MSARSGPGTNASDLLAREQGSAAIEAEAVGLTRPLWLFSLAGLAAIVALTVLGATLLHRALDGQSDDARLIAAAGQQTVLSRRISEAALVASFSTRPALQDESASELAGLLALIDRTHRGLRDGEAALALPGGNSAEVEAAFAQLEPSYEAMVAAAAGVLAIQSAAATPARAPSEPFIQDLLAAEANYRAAMQGIVVQYEAEAADRVAASKRLGLMLLGGVIVLVILEAIFLFRPLVRRVRSNTYAAAVRREARFQALVQNAPDAVVTLSASGNFNYASPSVEGIWDLPPDDLRDLPLTSLIHPSDQAHAEEIWTALTREPGEARLEVRMRHRDGSWRDIDATMSNRLDDPSVGAIVMNARDVSDRKELEAQLTRQALYDTLTGLPNRALLLDRLALALADRRQEGDRVAVLFLGIDRFKVVNDSLGHAAGDQLLTAIGQRLFESVGPGYTVARYGGDEFAVVMGALDAVDPATAAADRIRGALKQSFLLNGREAFITVGIGIALSGPRAVNPRDLLRNADVALYTAKATGPGECIVYDEAQDGFTTDRVQLQSDLHKAHDRGELAVAYQPIVDLATRDVIGFEALARWHHPTHGLIPPDEFIPLAEETGDISAIGQWVLEEACSRFGAWQAALPPGRRHLLCVNVSPVQLREPRFLDHVEHALRLSGLHPSSLEIEVTETAMMADFHAAVALLESLRSFGVRVAIDDFGTGYSSLSYLSRVPADTLKIDRSFVQELSGGPQPRSALQAIAALARAFGLKTIVEGIEHEEQAAWLQQAGCDWGQGYLFARPMNPEQAAALLAAGTVRPQTHAA